MRGELSPPFLFLSELRFAKRVFGEFVRIMGATLDPLYP